MRSLLWVCGLLAVNFLTSCGFYDHRERILLHKEITATNDTLDKLTKEWHIQLDKAIKTKDFSKP